MATEIVKQFLKGDDEVLDFVLDWSRLLAGDTISTSAWATPTGITKSADTNTTTTTTVWLGGGTVGQTYDCENTVVTAGGRTYERTIRIKVIDR